MPCRFGSPSSSPPASLEIPWLAARCTSPSRYQCVCAAVCPLAASPTAHVCQGRWTPWTSPVPGLWYAVLLLTMRGPGSLPGSAAFLVVTTCHTARRPSPRPLTFCKPPSRIPLLVLPRSPSLVLRAGRTWFSDGTCKLFQGSIDPWIPPSILLLDRLSCGGTLAMH